MERHLEQRGNYTVAYYTISVSEEMKRAALDFAQRIITTDNQYSRLLPASIRRSRDADMQQKVEIQRTYMGKLGELVFLHFLEENHKQVRTDGMFDVFAGQANVDSFDFQTADGRSVDVKTGFCANHQRLLVNIEQFNNIPKDFYVAVKIDAVDVDPVYKLVDWERISTAKIVGYAEYSYMQAHAGIGNFGEGNARFLFYDRLLGIDRLLSLF